jgi:hypothetical protein
MVDDRWDTARIFSELERVFEPRLVRSYAALIGDPSEGFRRVRREFSAGVSMKAPGNNDINADDEAKKTLILAHVLLAIFSALSKGSDRWTPLPELQGRRWPDVESDLLMWAAKHGSSDIRTIPDAPGTPTAAAAPQER